MSYSSSSSRKGSPLCSWHWQGMRFALFSLTFFFSATVQGSAWYFEIHFCWLQRLLRVVNKWHINLIITDHRARLQKASPKINSKLLPVSPFVFASGLRSLATSVSLSTLSSINCNVLRWIEESCKRLLHPEELISLMTKNRCFCWLGHSLDGRRPRMWISYLSISIWASWSEGACLLGAGAIRNRLSHS